jgi:hypothetical protein
MVPFIASRPMKEFVVRPLGGSLYLVTVGPLCYKLPPKGRTTNSSSFERRLRRHDDSLENFQSLRCGYTSTTTGIIIGRRPVAF